MSKSIDINEYELFELYVNKRRTMTKIASKFNCSRKTIFNRLKQLNIKRKLGLCLPMNEIQELYEKNGNTSQQIADMFHCNRGSIEKRLKKMNVKINNKQRKYWKFYNQVFTDSQLDLIKGTILGDACIEKSRHNGCRMSVSHCKKQFEYLMWKKNRLNNFVTDKYPEEINKLGTNSFSQGLHYRFYTITHDALKTLRNEFYDEEGNKKVEYFRLTPLSLAAWYYDDGDLHKRSGTIRLHTESFSIQSIHVLTTMLKDSFDISSNIRSKKAKWNGVEKEYNIIYINRRNASKLIDIVSAYNITGMEYKLGLSNNPVETQCYNTGVSDLKCSDANTLSSVFNTDDGIVHGSRKR